MTDNKPSFEVLEKSPEVLGKNGIVMIATKQRITQPDGSHTDHVCLTKYRRNIDGSQSGRSTQVFIPLALVNDVFNAVKVVVGD